MTELRVTIPDGVAERLASKAAERGTTAEDLAANVLRKSVPAPREPSLPFIGMFDGLPGAPSAAELARRLDEWGRHGMTFERITVRPDG